MGGTETDGANGILRSTAITMPLKYLSNFERWFETPLINCKVELKLKWTNHCVLSVAGDDNDANLNNTIFTIKETKLSIPVITLLAKDNKKLSKLLNISLLGWI